MSKAGRSKYEEIDLSRVKTFRMADLARRVDRSAFAKPLRAGASLAEFIKSMPDILAAEELRQFARHVADAAESGKPVIVMFGGHVIKTGLAPLLIELMKRRVITALATNGSGTIHDTEIALFGRTSEDVAEGLADGSFGMSRDTADFINKSINDGADSGLGYGEALGMALSSANAPYERLSLLVNADRLNIPLTVHAALGTDINHQHPSADGAAIGRASMRDFRVFANEVGKLREGSVVLNIGSAVIMPEVFLKALTVARNLGYPAHGFIAANFDMIVHYRPTQNVLFRP
ncbi:MAG TPA: hypothetical protein ENL08_04310, partial [Bacteroidetes bacterium]|nr:hypothetical protein [Bacteroidota bacterium]